MAATRPVIPIASEAKQIGNQPISAVLVMSAMIHPSKAEGQRGRGGTLIYPLKLVPSLTNVEVPCASSHQPEVRAASSSAKLERCHAESHGVRCGWVVVRRSGERR